MDTQENGQSIGSDLEIKAAEEEKTRQYKERRVWVYTIVFLAGLGLVSIGLAIAIYFTLCQDESCQWQCDDDWIICDDIQRMCALVNNCSITTSCFNPRTAECKEAVSECKWTDACGLLFSLSIAVPWVFIFVSCMEYTRRKYMWIAGCIGKCMNVPIREPPFFDMYD